MSAAESGQAGEPDSASGAIAVVDDNAANRRLVADFLHALGYTAHGCADGQACLDLLAQESLDAVLLDIMMPGLDGLDVLARIRGDPATAQLPVLMVSARDEAESVVNALNAGADDYITKPIDLTVLRTRLAGHLGRYRAQAALAAKEAQLGDITANLPGVVYRMAAAPGAEAELTFVGAGLAELLGWPAGSPAPERLADLAADRAYIRALAASVERSRRDGTTLERELPVTTGDGSQRWVEVRATPRREADGTTIWNGLLIDITARKRAEAGRERLRAALNAAHDMIAMISPDGRHVTYVNQGLVEQLGYSEAALAQMAPDNLYADLPEGGFAELVAPLLDGERQVLTAQRTMRRASGSAVPVDVLLQAVTLPDDERVIVQIARDVSERAAAIEALTASEQRLRTIFDAVPVAFLTLDEGGLVRSLNAAGQRMFGRDREGLIGSSVEPLFDSDSLQTLQADLAAFQALGKDPTEGRGRELRALKPDGTAVPVHLHWASWRQPGWFYTAMLRDLTPEKETQTALRQAQKMEAIGQLTGGLAHDFNNLLAVMLGNLDLLVDDLQDRPDLSRRAQKALEAAERGAQLTQRLLAFSRRQPLEPQSIDLNATVRSIIELIARTLGPSIAIEMDLADRLPPTRLDPGELENVLLNLAINARDAMPEGGTLTIASWLPQGDEAILQGREGHFVGLSVADTGTGMSEAVRQRIFEPFFSTKEVGEGTGLGLATVFGFVQQSGGEITVESERGKGTRFSLYLPVAPAEAEGPAAAQAPQTPEHFDGLSALLVEDDPEVRQLTQRLLTDLGLSVVAVANADRGLARLDGGTPADVLVSDMLLPGGQYGPDLAEAAVSRRPGLAVVLMSGYILSNLPAGGAAAQRAARLTKPFRRDELAQALAEALARRPAPA